MEPSAPNAPDVRERGVGPDGRPRFTDRRLYMQFLAYGNCRTPDRVASLLRERGVAGAVYLDLNDPMGIGVVAADERPDFFVGAWRSLLQDAAFQNLAPKPEYTLFGRTYAIGYETDLDHALVDRPLHRLRNPDWPWVVWYPLRRKGSFEQLTAGEQREILTEHGVLGGAYGEADLAHDIRLACFGLDKNDNDFVVGLVGRALQPLSAVVQAMRKTRQTALHIERLGPFFIGKAVWQSPL